MQANPNKPQGQNEIKQHNLNMILSVIRSEKSISRIELSRRTGMSPTSMTRIVGELIDMELVNESSIKTGSVGRNATQISLNPKAFYTLAIKLDKESIRVGLMDFNYRLVGTKQVRSPSKRAQPRTILGKAKVLYDTLLIDCGVKASDVKAMGLCCGGTVARAEKSVLFSSEFMWTDEDLRPICAALFDLPLVVENDVKADLVSETLHYPYDVKNIAYLKLESGFEAAAICDGYLNTNAGGALGHTTVDSCGRLCDCGRRGCLNTLADERFLIEEAQKFANEVTTLDEVMMAYQLENQWARSLVSDLAMVVAMAFNQLICMYNPAVILVSGLYFRRYPFLLSEALLWADLLFYKPLAKGVVIEMASSESTEGLAGIGILAQESVMESLLLNSQD